MKSFSVNAVVCSRRGTFDAEIQFVEESYSGGDLSRDYIQKLLQAGFPTREAAKSVADAEVSLVQDLLRKSVADYLSRYPNAQA